MRDVTNQNFGLLIAYVLPGLTALWGASHFSPTLRAWIGDAPEDVPTIGGFLYLTLAAITAAIIVSTVRWMVLDTVHYRTGVPRPRWDFSRFDEKVIAYGALGEVHYRYYEFYGGMLVALTFTYLAGRIASGSLWAPIGWSDAAAFVLACILAAGSLPSCTYRNWRKPATRGQSKGVGPMYRQNVGGNPQNHPAEDEAVQLAEEAFLAEISGLVTYLTERLTGQTDGKPKVFRDSAVDASTSGFLA